MKRIFSAAHGDVRTEAAKRIAKTRRADADPIFGKNGPLTRLWRQDALNMRRAAPRICSSDDGAKPRPLVSELYFANADGSGERRFLDSKGFRLVGRVPHPSWTAR